MSRAEKLIARFREQPSDFTWDELVRLLEALNDSQAAPGSTGGSQRRFVHATAPTILLHKPHPGNVVKRYVMAAVRRVLQEEGLV